MKKNMSKLSIWANLFLLFLLLVSCNNLDDINKRLDNLELTNEYSVPKLTSLEFLVTDNPVQLVNNVSGEIIGDSIIECWIPNFVWDKELVPSLSYIGDSIYLNGSKYELKGGLKGAKIDFKKPVLITIYSRGVTANYILYVHTFTGLPVLWIETEGREDILTKEYQSAYLRIIEDAVTRSAGDVVEGKVQIKCRGNTSYTSTDKKSYTIKFDEKVSLFDEPKDKSYVLIANAFDKTMLRNYLGYYMGKISNMDYSPNSHYVEVMLNGRYHGTYLFADKLKISKHRVNVGDDGFLLEIDPRAIKDNEVYFTTEKLAQPISIKDPDVVIDDENYNYIKDFVNTAERHLFSDSFKDAKEGWQKYMDIETFADWYIIEEIAKNGDARMYSSCYMNLKRGEKLKMGPVWDFDATFGNNIDYYQPEGFLVIESKWMQRLFSDPAFNAKVKERFMYFYNHKMDFLNMLNSMASYLDRSAKENNDRWHFFHETHFNSHDIWGTYSNEVTWLKNWLINRMDWMKDEFESIQ